MAIVPIRLSVPKRQEVLLQLAESVLVSSMRRSRLETHGRPPSPGASRWFVGIPFSFFLRSIEAESFARIQLGRAAARRGSVGKSRQRSRCRLKPRLAQLRHRVGVGWRSSIDGVPEGTTDEDLGAMPRRASCPAPARVLAGMGRSWMYCIVLCSVPAGG